MRFEIVNGHIWLMSLGLTTAAIIFAWRITSKYRCEAMLHKMASALNRHVRGHCSDMVSREDVAALHEYEDSYGALQ